jgi:hypothetical protein
MKRRPERLIRWIKRSGRREIEPEIFISSSCVGDQFRLGRGGIVWRHGTQCKLLPSRTGTLACPFMPCLTIRDRQECLSYKIKRIKVSELSPSAPSR